MQIVSSFGNQEKTTLYDKARKIDSLLTQLNSEGQFNGAVFLANNENIIFQSVYGYSDIYNKKALTNETQFEIASVSKTITATLIMKLVENGQLSLETKLVQYFPDMPYEDITVEHLLTHTSGIPFYYDSLIKDHWGVGRVLNTDTVFHLYEKLKPKQEFRSGQEFSYSNAGYMLLAGIAERATRKSFDQLLDEYIFSKANMNSTKRDVRLIETDSYAYGHQISIEKGAYVPLSMHEDSLKMLDYFFKDSKGPGGIYASLNDLWKFSMAIQSNVIFKDETKELMFLPTRIANGTETNYGKGWQLTQSNGSKFVHHRGGSEGFNCFYFIALDEEYTYFLVSNTKSYYLSEINEQVKNILNSKPTKKILKSGVERIALKLNRLSNEELNKEIKLMKEQQDEYYFALHEFNEIAWNYWTQENYDEGIRIIKLATIAMPDNAGAFEVLAEAYKETGRTELAIENYKTTIAMLNADEKKKDKKWVKDWIADMKEIISNLEEN